DLEVLADAPVHAHQPAVARAAVGHIQPPELGQGVPLVAQPHAQLQRAQGRPAVQPFPDTAAHAVFAPAAGELAGDLPALVELADALEREHVAALVVAGAADLAAAGQVVEVGVPAEGGPARAAMRAPGEAQVDLAELGFVVGAEPVTRARVVGAQGHAPVLVDAPHQAVGGHPLVALLGAAVAAVLELAGPLHARVGAPGTDAVGAAVHRAADRVEFRVHDGQADVPARRRQQVHAEGVRDAGLAACGFLQVLALAEHPRAVGDARTLAQRPAVAHRRVEQAVAGGGVRAPAVAAVDRAVGVEVVFGLEPGAMPAAAGAGLGADAGAIAEQ